MKTRKTKKKIEPYKKRMGWQFKWVSSGQTEYNYDYQASFHAEDIKRKKGFYNYQTFPINVTDREGISVFCKDETGAIFHTYSTYARGIDAVNPTYQFLDLTPKGRDESEKFPQDWVRHKDRYA